MLSGRRDLADQTETKSGVRVERLGGEQVASAYRTNLMGSLNVAPPRGKMPRATSCRAVRGWIPRFRPAPWQPKR